MALGKDLEHPAHSISQAESFMTTRIRPLPQPDPPDPSVSSMQKVFRADVRDLFSPPIVLEMTYIVVRGE